MTGFKGNIEKLTISNKNFRTVLFTGQHMQLVLMTLQPGEEIGEEIHTVTDQFFRVEYGTGKVVMDGTETIINNGDAFIVPAGTKHNVINTSSENPLKLYTIYSPPHHKDGTVHGTKKAAEEDTGDHL